MVHMTLGHNYKLQRDVKAMVRCNDPVLQDVFYLNIFFLCQEEDSCGETELPLRWLWHPDRPRYNQQYEQQL